MRIHTRSKRHLLALFAAALVMGFVVGPTGVAAGQNQPPPVTIDQGVLVLELGAVDRFAQYDTGGQLVATQSITTQGCRASLGGPASLATLAPLPATSQLGMFADGIGVRTQGSGGNGQPCGRVDGPNEGLVFALGGDLAGVDIARAELDIEGKFNVMVDAALYDDGTLVATESLGTGDLSDSGPDSGDGDNYRWEIDPGTDGVADILFDQIVFTVSGATPTGAFSLEGGADGTAPGSLGISGSTFALVNVFDGVIDCGQNTFTTGDGDTDPKATFTRGDDDDKNPDPCSALIGFNLSSSVSGGQQTVSFEFETEEAPSWFGTFTWTPESSLMPGVQPTTVDGDPLQWCNGFDGTDDEAMLPKPVLPVGESWCLITQTSSVAGPGLIQVTQTIYGETDPNFIRPK